jgi:hypothetical protein
LGTPRASTTGRKAANFSKDTRQLLAFQAGYSCGFPGCKNPCVGPSQESAASKSDTGTACHIIAAADGPAARRTSTTMSDKDRRDPANGIWMCNYHGKLIDSDEATYSVEALRAWKALALRRAQLSQMLARPASLSVDDPDLNSLAPMGVQVMRLEGSRAAIRDLFVESAAFVAWGDELAAAARDLVVEIASNALRHGGASTVLATVEPRRFVVTDDGAEFDPRTLPDHSAPDGGAAAVRVIQSDLAGRLLIDHRHEAGKNRTTITAVKSRADLMLATPCFVDTDLMAAGKDAKAAELTRVQNCETVYIFPPEGMTYSDRGEILVAAADVLALGKHPVLVMHGDISKGVAGMINQFMSIDMISIEDDTSQFHRPDVAAILDLRRNEKEELLGGVHEGPPFLRF